MPEGRREERDYEALGGPGLIAIPANADCGQILTRIENEIVRDNTTSAIHRKWHLRR